MGAQSGTAEESRLAEAREQGTPWRKWGPYLSERQWGTVREDYSAGGNAWDYFTHDHARSRAYQWGEDGIAGFSDDKQHLCFALALWNGKDAILKERMFGLTNGEGNHGEDVKEYYFYLDNTPTHSYMKYLYKYPQREFPYADLVNTSRQRSRGDMEYELLDTGIFNENRYFDVFVEYAKKSPEDVLIKVEVVNRGPETAKLSVLPTMWFRNTWSSSAEPKLKPGLRAVAKGVIAATHAEMGNRFLYCNAEPAFLFTENETNNERIFGTVNTNRYVKDAFHDYVVQGRKDAVNPDQTGTKAAALYQIDVESGKTVSIRLRLSDQNPIDIRDAFVEFDDVLDRRRREADEFYKAVTPSNASIDEANVLRQAMAGMLWSKQYYFMDVDKWLRGHHAHPLTPHSSYSRNREWFHMMNDHVISMPDKWEYPWYAAWDLAFHSVALSVVDVDFAKQQLDLMLQNIYMHPTGQIPAYEWNYSDVNPPVHAWASLFLYRTEQALRGKGDHAFLRRMFQKLMLNFNWWVNRKDRAGNNAFEGGFLGLDNIGVFDRSSPLPTGGYLEQADGTAWMCLFCHNMLEIAVELAAEDPTYQDMAVKFAEHFTWIAAAVNRVGDEGMWDEEDGFYYDVLRTPDGRATRLKVRSMVGLLPFCAVSAIEPWQRELVPEAVELFRQQVKRMPELLQAIHPTGPGHLGVGDRGIFALVNKERLLRILNKMLDPNEFLSPYGIRALSRYHADHPYVYHLGGQDLRVNYLPAESDSGMFGGNSNWRGPVWMPVNCLIIRALLSYYTYYGDNFKVECPTGSGKMMNLFEVAKEIAARLTRIFLRDGEGRRPVFGGAEKFQADPHWKDCILFYEYFHGDNGAGLGASHQTGWTGTIANLIHLFGNLDPQKALLIGKTAGFTRPGKDEAKADEREPSFAAKS